MKGNYFALYTFLHLKGSPADFWLVLVENSFSHRTVIAMLFYFIEAGGSKVCVLVCYNVVLYFLYFVFK